MQSRPHTPLLSLKGTLKSHLKPFPYILKTTAILCWHLYWCCVIFLNKHSIIGEVLVGLSLFAGIFFCISVFHCWSSIKFPVTLPRRRTKFQKVARFQNWLVFKSINNEASLLTNIFQLVDRLDRLIDWWSPIYFVQTKPLKNLLCTKHFLRCLCTAYISWCIPVHRRPLVHCSMSVWSYDHLLRSAVAAAGDVVPCRDSVFIIIINTRAANDPSVLTIMEKAPTRASIWLKVPFTFQTLLRRLNMK